MNRIVKYALTGAVKALVGSNIFDQIRNTVEQINNEELSGDEKRALAISALKEMGLTIANILLNLAIEVAVLLLKEQVKEG